MRTGFVLTTVGLALALGIIAGVSENRLLTGALVIGLAPAIWAASYVVERLTARDMWHFSAPYPYRWMREHREAAPVPPNTVGKPVENVVETERRSARPLAA